MTTFLDTQNISSEIANLIRNSKDRLYLITPYLQLNRLIKPLIKDIVFKNPRIQIILVCRSDKINVEDMKFLQDLKNVQIWALDNLHAKCYINEETAIITSMNLFQFSEGNNYEMGIKIDKKTDEPIYQQISDYIDIIMRESKEYEIKTKNAEKSTNQKNTSVKEYSKSSQNFSNQNSGFCIRCGAEIPLNPNKPLCMKCYSIWVKRSDPTNPENCCHVCGKESKQSVEKPVCYNCYKKLYK